MNKTLNACSIVGVLLLVAWNIGCGGHARVESPASNVQSSTAKVQSPTSNVQSSIQSSSDDPDKLLNRNRESEAQSLEFNSKPISRELKSKVERIAATAKGKVGVAAMVLETGESFSLNGRGHFPMQSVYKVPISMAVMQAVDAGKIKLTDKVAISKSDFVGRAAHSPIRDKYPNGTSLSVEELLRYALVESDGTASDALMKLAGGPTAVQAYLSELGIKEMIVLDTEQAFAQDHSLQYRNWTTPEAAVALLRALHERRGLSEAGQALVLRFMTESTTGPKRLKGLLPAGAVVAHKTGTSGTEKGITAATNDIGIITLPTDRHLAIAVFVADSPAGMLVREGVIAKIAKAVVDSSNE